MAGMWAVAQRVDHPEVQPLERCNTLIRQATEVAGIGQSAEPKSEGGNVAVLLPERQSRIAPADP